MVKGNRSRADESDERDESESTAPPADPDLPQHQFTPFEDINEVPETMRRYRNARLTLKQINAILKDAYANQFPQEGSLVPDFGNARARFEKQHHIEGGFWVSGPPEKSDDGEDES